MSETETSAIMAYLGRMIAANNGDTNSMTIMTPAMNGDTPSVLIVEAKLLTLDEAIDESDGWINVINALREGMEKEGVL